jgi:hypothetical protein
MLQRTERSGKEAKQAAPEPIRYDAPPLKTGWRAWFVVSCLLLACSLILTWPWLSGHVTIPWDARGHFQAQAAFLAQSIQSGQSPFWAPYIFGGHPQIADPQSLIFSPPYLLLAFLTANPTFEMVDGMAFASLVFGAFGILGFARDRRWHPAAALVAALAFAFGGSAAWRIQHIGQILSLAYFPWALWMLERGLRLSSLRYGALAGLFAALMVLGPDQVTFLELITLSGFVVSHWIGGAHPLGRIRASIRPLAAGAALGILIVTIPSLMVLSFADGSNRAHIRLEDAALGSLHPSNLLTFVISNLFGTIGPGEDFWGAPSVHWPYIVWSNLARNMANFYMGILPLLGLVTWLTFRMAYARRVIVFVALFALMIVYALGTYTPIFPLLYQLLPGADLFRRPADSLFLVGALGAILAGFGLDALLRRSEGGFPVVARRAVAGVLIFGFAGGIGMAIWLKKTGQAWPEILYAILTVGISFMVLKLAIPHARRHPLLVAGALATCLTADFAWNIRPNDSTGLDPKIYSALRLDAPNETLEFLKSHVVQNGTRRDRVEFAGLGFEWPNAALVHKIESTLGYNPLRMGFYSSATGAEDHVAGWDQRRFGKLMSGYRSAFSNLLGLRYVVTSVPIEKIDPGMGIYPLPLVARTREGFIYENPDALPRVMLVPEAQAIDQDKLVATGVWPSTDLRKTAFVEPSALPLPHGGKGGTASITHYENTRVEIDVSAPDGGVLLLNDVYHPWWFATIDGRPAKILRTNGVFRGVILPQNAKRVIFTFEPLRGLARRHLVKRGIISG